MSIRPQNEEFEARGIHETHLVVIVGREPEWKRVVQDNARRPEDAGPFAGGRLDAEFKSRIPQRCNQLPRLG